VSCLNRPGLRRCVQGFKQLEREGRDSLHNRGLVLWRSTSRREETREVGAVGRAEMKLEEEEWVRNNMRAWQARERKREAGERERRKGDEREDDLYNLWLVLLSLLLLVYGGKWGR